MNRNLLGFAGCLIMVATITSLLILGRTDRPLSTIPASHPVPPIPTAILSCLPALEHQELKAVLPSGDTTYYAIGGDRSHTYDLVLIALNRGRCYVLRPANQRLPVTFLNAFVSQELAQQLWLQIYRRTMHQLGGRSAFQQRLDRTATQLPAGKRGYLAPEQGWALQQLGISIPDRLHIITATDYLSIQENPK
ncbi:hypothetical protein BST81_12825 [Leptolyngbya sp. 'hensonii']|uniref:hypothetical protein n=1 Tax=Leptolyngbya sp. 'hensonii' TaxID=1922337 RepID=UPI00094F8DD4|nr:hypothetical protein [Leptolyngbya sp. 'hensonii']OLP17934.1 hypothetical protein BST81_12825 [Leptolyngbya sp. 'hensonii']